MKNIYILNSCNEWKERGTMSLMAATTSPKKIKSIIIQQIREDNLTYQRGEDGLSKTKQIQMLRKDWAEMGEDFVFRNITFGYVDVVVDGELQ